MQLPVNYNDLHFTERKKVRDEYIRIQKGACQYCAKPLANSPCVNVLKNKVNKKLFPKSFFDWPIHLHHNRDTGLTIGAVHNYCNAVLWQYHGE